MGSYLDRVAAEIGSRCGLTMVEHVDRYLLRIYAVLCLAKGTYTTNEDVHNAWVAATIEDRAAHPSAIPYDQLKGAVQLMDEPYRDAIHQVSMTLSSPRSWPERIADQLKQAE